MLMKVIVLLLKFFSAFSIICLICLMSLRFGILILSTSVLSCRKLFQISCPVFREVETSSLSSVTCIHLPTFGKILVLYNFFHKIRKDIAYLTDIRKEFIFKRNYKERISYEKVERWIQVTLDKLEDSTSRKTGQKLWNSFLQDNTEVNSNKKETDIMMKILTQMPF